MSDAETDNVTCPGCGKSYRWKEILVGRLVPCRKCGTEFTVPKQPGQGEAIDTSGDNQDSVYALAVDIDDLPEPKTPPPPAAMVDPTDTAETPKHEPPAPAVKTTDAPPGEAGVPSEQDGEAEAPAHVSEAAKAKRREEQRLAAAAAQPARSWRDYKLLIILGGVVVGVAIAVWILTSVSDALDGILG